MNDRDSSDAVLDEWLRTSLRQSFAAVEAEPIPDALLRLLSPETAPSGWQGQLKQPVDPSTFVEADGLGSGHPRQARQVAGFR